ncbi:MAG: OmpA family protein [Nannocystaceae bacterium]
MQAATIGLIAGALFGCAAPGERAEDSRPPTDGVHGVAVDVPIQAPESTQVDPSPPPSDAAPPEPADADRDGLADVDDRCPTAPELVNDVDDEDGCPDAGPAGFALKASYALVLEHAPIEFVFNSIEVQRACLPLLDAIATLVLRNPHLGVLHVETHTDSRGASDYNLELSRRQAAALGEELAARGVPRERVRVEGFGETRPISHCPRERPRCNNRVDLWFEPTPPIDAASR